MKKSKYFLIIISNMFMRNCIANMFHTLIFKYVGGLYKLKLMITSTYILHFDFLIWNFTEN